jgi:hypothetical protein
MQRGRFSPRASSLPDCQPSPPNARPPADVMAAPRAKTVADGFLAKIYPVARSGRGCKSLRDLVFRYFLAVTWPISTWGPGQVAFLDRWEASLGGAGSRG